MQLPSWSIRNPSHLSSVMPVCREVSGLVGPTSVRNAEGFKRKLAIFGKIYMVLEKCRVE